MGGHGYHGGRDLGCGHGPVLLAYALPVQPLLDGLDEGDDQLSRDPAEVGGRV